MTIQKTALASAVGVALAVSGAATSVAYADGHDVSVYGRVNTAYVMNELDGPGVDVDSTNISSIVPRVGIKASAPINESTKAHARYEWSTSSDDETGAFGDTRIAEVGVTGDFGTVKVGNMWSTYYNMVGTHLDPTVTLGAVLYSTSSDLPYRVSNAIQYSNSFGMVSVSAEIRLNDEDNPDDVPNAQTEKIGESDGNAIGVSFTPVEGLTLAAVVDSQDGVGAAGDEDRIGLAAKYAMDNWWVSLSLGETDIDDLGTATQTQVWAGMDFGGGWSGLVGLGTVEYDADSGSDPDDSDATVLNVTKRIGGGFRVYYEGIMAGDVGSGNAYDQDTHIFGARIDF